VCQGFNAVPPFAVRLHRHLSIHTFYNLIRGGSKHVGKTSVACQRVLGTFALVSFTFLQMLTIIRFTSFTAVFFPGPDCSTTTANKSKHSAHGIVTMAQSEQN
jgi:hypothetical protein